MRFFLNIFLALAALTAFAAAPAFATAISKEEANNYYAQCKSKQDPRMMAETQDAFCACTAATMMQAMTVEEVQVMKGNDQASRAMLNKMLLDVYAPCMSYPVQDLVISSCIKDPNIDKAGSNIAKTELCACMGKKSAEWFTQEGRTLMKQILDANPNIYDPIGPVMESKSFKAQSYRSITACMTGGR